MSVLIVAVLFGLIFSFFATQNTSSVIVNLGSYLFEIPLYLVVLGSLLAGLLVSWAISLVDWLSSSLTLMGKDSKIKADERQINDLNERVHQLEIENSKLKGEDTKVIEIETPKKESHFWHKFRSHAST